MKSELRPTGKVTISVYDELNNLKYKSENHNIITEEGDAYIADLLAISPARTKITTGNCFIPVGTGWTGIGTKQNSWVNTQVGNAQAIDATFPKLKGTWTLTNDNVLMFQVTYAQGSLNFSGINEAALTSHATDVVANTTLAYAQISPPVNVSSTDILIIEWELTFLGA